MKTQIIAAAALALSFITIAPAFAERDKDRGAERHADRHEQKAIERLDDHRG